MFTRTVKAVVAFVVVALLSGCGSYVEFSPDGKRLLVSGDPEGLLVMNADGSARQRLPNTRDAAYAIWSPDGRHILYQRMDKYGNAVGISLHDLQQHTTRNLPGALSTPYTFSHDGRQVVAWDKQKACMVWLDASSGERLLEVPCPVTPQNVIRLYWLPDRQGVAFLAVSRSSEQEASVDVYTVEAGKLYRISTTGDIVGLGVSPDGKRLLWARQVGLRRDATVRIFSYDLDARSVEKLPLQVRIHDLITWRLPKGAMLSARVEFSPDAQSVLIMPAYFTEKEASPFWHRGVVLSLSGGQPREVFSSQPYSRRPEMLISVAWSPDSRQTALLTLQGTQQGKQQKSSMRVRVLHPDGTRQRIIDL